MMMKSPTHSKSEASYYDAYGFDLQEDFSQFLEEARKYEMTEAKVKSSSSVYPESRRRGGKREDSSDKEREEKSGKKKKKSWKSSVISWLKAEKKSKPTTTTNNINSEEPIGSCGKKQSHVSGPIYDSGKPTNAKKQWRPHSGPLITSLFSKSSKRENQNEIPYVCLQQHLQQNSPQDSHIQDYGPLYVIS